MSWRRTGLLALALMLIAIGVGGAAAFAASPPTVQIEVIGKGKVTGTGISCGVGALACYTAYGTDPSDETYTATAASGWTFSHWEDDASGCGTNSTCEMTAASTTGGTPVTGDMTLTAVFTANASVQPYSMTVVLSGDGAVTNNSVNYPIDCAQGTVTATTCSVTAVAGSTITVKEQPDSGYLFQGWGGTCSGNHVSCSVYLNTNQTVSANFVASTTHTLSVQISGAGSVTGKGVSCGSGSTCDYPEPSNTTVTLTATPQSGYAFTKWTGDCLGTQNTCSVQMDADRNVVAEFDPLIPVAITVNGNGTVSGAGVTCGPGPKTCTGEVPQNTSVLLTGTPALSGSSVTWTGCTSTSGTICRIAVGTTPVAVTATFGTGTGPQPSVSLNVNVNGDGYVMSTSGTTAIYCTAIGGAGCTTSVPQGTTVTLKAIVASGNANDFTDWGNDDCSTFTSTTCTLTMNGAKSVTANFNGPDTTYDLTALIEGSGNISGAGLHCSVTGGSGCTSPQAAGATVTVTAVPAFGATFVGWSGACTGSAPTCNISMSNSKTVTAQFKQAAPGKQLFTITVTGKGSVKGTAGTCTSKTGKATTCTQQYTDGTKVTLTAKAAAGWAFSGWKGACAGTKATCTVSMVSALSTSATFTPLPLVLTHKPRVTKISGGYRLTIYYNARVSGTLKVLAVRGSTKVAHSKHVAKGSGKLLVTLKRDGTYHVTLSLTAKHKTTKIRFVVKT